LRVDLDDRQQLSPAADRTTERPTDRDDRKTTRPMSTRTETLTAARIPAATKIPVGGTADLAARDARVTTRRRRPGPRALSTVCGLLVAVGALTVTAPATAGAATLDGVATTASPGTTNYLASGGSQTPFTVSLPAQAACSGDTATKGYHVYSYLVEKGTNVTTVTFINTPSVGYGLVNNVGTYYGAANTAPTTGQIIGIPNNFEWGPLVSNDGVTLDTLLYQNGNTSGVWEAGLACANSSGTLTDYWNTEVTFTAFGFDPNKFVWSAVPGPSGSAVPAFTSANSTSFTEGQSNSFTPTASGNPAPTITESGTLPSGVTFTSGSLTGTPTQTGTFPIVFTATNGIGNPATQNFTLTVVTAGFHISSTSPLPAATIGQSYSDTLTATGGPTPYTWKVTGLPKGLKVNKTTGTISGTPSNKDAVKTYSVSVTVKDHAKPKGTATGTFSLTLNS
jgi:putative Ig domain-containing protein